MHRVMDKNCVKASCSTKSGLHDVNESKWCNAYADDTIPCAVSAEPTPFPFLKFSKRRMAFPDVDAMAKT